MFDPTYSIRQRIGISDPIPVVGDPRAWRDEGNKIRALRVEGGEIVGYEESETARISLFLYRGRNVYSHAGCLENTVGELIKSIGLVACFALHTVVIKFLFQGVVYGIAKCLSSCVAKELEENYGCRLAWTPQKVTIFGKERQISLWLWVPLRIIIGLIVQPIISVLAVCTLGTRSSSINKLNGDIERWINGHTDKDLETKSWGRRLNEGCYMAPCQQPLYRSELKDMMQRSLKERRVAFQAGIYAMEEV